MPLWSYLVVLAVVTTVVGINVAFIGATKYGGQFPTNRPLGLAIILVGVFFAVASIVLYRRDVKRRGQEQVQRAATELDAMYAGTLWASYLWAIGGGLVFSIFVYFAATAYGGDSLMQVEIVVAIFGFAFLFAGIYRIWLSKKYANHSTIEVQ